MVACNGMVQEVNRGKDGMLSGCGNVCVCACEKSAFGKNPIDATFMVL